MNTYKIPNFFEYIQESKTEVLVEKKTKSESRRNYEAYLKGKEPLRVAILSHPEGNDDVFDFIKGNISERFSVYPKGYWEKFRKEHRQALLDVLNNRKAWN